MNGLKSMVNTNDRSLCAFACVAFVTASNSTLLTRQYALPCDQMRADHAALEEKRGEKVYVVRSFDHNGSEVGTELITPAALKRDSALARVEFWQRCDRAGLPRYVEGQEVSKSLFRLAGVLIVPAENALREAYDYLEYPFSRWNPNLADGMSPAPNFGDIFVMSSAATPENLAFALTDGYTPIALTD